jgi:cellulose 1,4-beta-cellobiosidase
MSRLLFSVPKRAVRALPAHWVYRLIAAILLSLVAASGAVAQSAGCQVTYTKGWEGGNGFGADIAILNNGPAITNGWTLLFSFPNGQRIQNGWPVSLSQPAGSAQVTVASNAPWNQGIGSGATFNVGFNGTFSGANDPPPSFVLNGTPCNGDGSTQLSISATPSTLSLAGGTSGTSTIRLSAAPTSPVTVTLTRSGSTAIAHAPTTVTLNNMNWDTGVNVTFTAAAGTTTATATFAATAAGYTTASIPVTRTGVVTGRADNPYAGAGVYNNPQWRANAVASGGSAIANQPTAVWMDRISSITGNGSPTTGSMGLVDHLEEALVQDQANGANPFVIQFVIYNLPGRDCSALASNGELGPNDLPRYKTEYIDVIAEILRRPAYANLRIVAIIEIDSLPNLVTNVTTRVTGTPECDVMLQNRGYVDGVGYALATFGAIPNVYNYVDAGHHGWLGWDTNLNPSIDMIATAAVASGSVLANVHGFITNTANTSALQEPYITVDNTTRPSRWIDWNQFNDELTYAQAFRRRAVEVGFSPNIGMLIDTSRNGWGGAARPTGPSTAADLDARMDASRVDRRIHKGNWCNPAGAGLGERPRAAPAEGIDAYVWIKPPGESDGSSTFIQNDEGKGFDRMCDPTYGGNPRNNNNMTGALPDAPLSGHWFPAQFQQLLQNAFPPL